MEPKKQVRLSHITFTLALEEMLSGSFTSRAIVEQTGMGHRYVNSWIRTMHAKKVVHICGWDKDTIGRATLRVYALGAGRDAKKPTKQRTQINRDYRARAGRSALAGTPFAGLGG